MKRSVLLISCLFCVFLISRAQVSVNADGTQPDPSAMLDVKSTTHGMLVPRLTTSQIFELMNPANGLLVYNTDEGKLYIFVSSDGIWKEVSYGTGTITPFTCGSNFTDARDSQTYSTILIGSQCWMRRNLNYGTMIDSHTEQTNNGIAEKYCWSNLPPYCDIYGGLYQWAEMVQYLNGASNYESWNPVPTGNVQGLCPANWHVATNEDWVVLREYLGGSGAAGGALKEAGYDHWEFPNIGATNSSNFTALPGGLRYSTGDFYYLATQGWFWAASEAYPAVGGYFLLQTNNGNLDQNIFDKQNGFSVRCVHN